MLCSSVLAQTALVWSPVLSVVEHSGADQVFFKRFDSPSSAAACVMLWGAQVTVVVFIFGFGGFLAAWSGLYVPSGPDDPGNTILFSLLNSQGRQVGI